MLSLTILWVATCFLFWTVLIAMISYVRGYTAAASKGLSFVSLFTPYLTELANNKTADAQLKYKELRDKALFYKSEMEKLKLFGR